MQMKQIVGQFCEVGEKVQSLILFNINIIIKDENGKKNWTL